MPPKPNRGIPDRNAFHNITYLLFSKGLFLGLTGFYIISNYVKLFAINRSIWTNSLPNYLLVIIIASSLVGRVAGCFYSDKIGSIHTQILVTAVATVLAYSLLAVRTTAGLVVYSILFEVASGAFTGLLATGIVTLPPDKSKVGARLGMTLVHVGIGVLVGNPIAGAILGRNENWLGLLVFCASISVVTSMVILSSRIAKVRFSFDHKL